MVKNKARAPRAQTRVMSRSLTLGYSHRGDRATHALGLLTHRVPPTRARQPNNAPAQRPVRARTAASGRRAPAAAQLLSARALSARPPEAGSRDRWAVSQSIQAANAACREAGLARYRSTPCAVRPRRGVQASFALHRLASAADLPPAPR